MVPLPRYILIATFAHALARSSQNPNMPIGTAESEEKEDTDNKVSWPSYPAESPSTEANRKWLEVWNNSTTSSGYANYINLDDPERTAEYRHEAEVALPGGVAADAPAAMSLAIHNAERASKNAQKDVAWELYVRTQRDKFAAKLERAFMQTAPNKWLALKAAHAYPAPNAHMLNARGMMVALRAYVPVLNVEGLYNKTVK